MAQNGRTTSNSGLGPPRSPGAMNRRGALALLAAVVVLGLVGWIYLSQASDAAELHRCIRELRQQKEEFQRQNDQLTYEIARLASVERLEKRAHELGYVSVWQARFLAVAGYPAQDETAPDKLTALARRDPAEGATPSAVAAWWQIVTDQFESWAKTEQP